MLSFLFLILFKRHLTAHLVTQWHLNNFSFPQASQSIGCVSVNNVIICSADGSQNVYSFNGQGFYFVKRLTFTSECGHQIGNVGSRIYYAVTVGESKVLFRIFSNFLKIFHRGAHFFHQGLLRILCMHTMYKRMSKKL